MAGSRPASSSVRSIRADSAATLAHQPVQVVVVAGAGGHPALAEPGHQPHRPGPVGGHHERHPGLLHAAGVVAGVHRGEPVAPPGGAVLPQDQVQQLGELGEPVDPLPGRQRLAAQHGRVEADAARAEAEQQPAGARRRPAR